MKATILSSGLLLPFLFLLGCGASHEKAEAPALSKSSMAADTIGVSSILSSSAARSDKDDTSRRFIRTADLQFKVGNVRQATTRIEDVVAKHRGFVAFTQLNSQIDYTSSVEVSVDSTLETTHYTVENQMTLRVPNTELDSTLREIAGLVDYLDHRIIQADDASLQYLANHLTEQRMQTSGQRLTNAITQRGKKLNDITDSEETLLQKQKEADEARLRNRALLDQVAMSTVKLSIYQRQAIRRELVERERNISAYQPGFALRWQTALVDGWQILEVLILSLTKLWGLGLLFLVGVVLYRKFVPYWKKV